MIKTLENHAKLFEHMDNGAVIITPNKRLAQHVLQEYVAQHSVKIKPICLSYQAFLRFLFKKTRHKKKDIAFPALLNSFQQQLLWQKVLLSEKKAVGTGMLSSIMDAWARFNSWGLSLQQASFSINTQTQQYMLWHNKFLLELEKINAITEEQVGHYLSPHLEPGFIKNLIWTCFDDFHPQQKALQDTFTRLGCNQLIFELPNTPNTSYQFQASDEDQELMSLVTWTKEQLIKGHKRIGIVVPDLHLRAKRLKRIFLRYFNTADVNLSYGEPLSQLPIIAHALEFLNIDKTLHQKNIQTLFKSPFLKGSQSEFLSRVEMLHSVRIVQEERISLDSLIRVCEKKAPVLATLLYSIKPYPAKAGVDDWVRLFKQRLIDLGFPGEYPLDSVTYQAFTKLVNVWEEFLSYSVITREIKVEEAISSLQLLVNNTLFQPQKTNTPIQVLGMLEAAGCTFDALWVCGMTHTNLQKGNPSPFIPFSLQRENKMPFADPLREFELAKKIVQRLQNGSSTSIFSYPHLIEDIPQLPHPLIEKLPLFYLQLPQEKAKVALLKRQEEYKIPIKSFEKVAGGTAILANQAKCPFRAFSAHRLHAFSGIDPHDGLNPLERGQVIHRVMENLWKALGSQQQLLALSSKELEGIIEESIKVTLQPIASEERYSFSSLVEEIEYSRLKKLVIGCLEWEKQRPAFVIEAIEQSFSVQLGGVDFKVRVDRLDKVGDKKWIIDYKSSLPSQKPWYEERPEEPQLILYALLDNSINALLFLQLKTGQINCHGISEETVNIKGIQPLQKQVDWETQSQLWRENLNKVMLEFSQGHCAPLPNRPSICQQCEYSGLCRTSFRTT